MRTICRKRWLRVLVLLLMPVCLLFSIGPILLMIDRISQDLTPLSRVETILGIQVPQAATDVHHSYHSWQGVGINLRFTLPSNEALGYIANLQAGKECVYPTLKDNYNPLQDDSDWFKPSLAQTYAGQRCSANGYVYYLLLDKTNPTVPTIYLFSGAN
jgi:hypothetical protein